MKDQHDSSPLDLQGTISDPIEILPHNLTHRKYQKKKKITPYVNSDWNNEDQNRFEIILPSQTLSQSTQQPNSTQNQMDLTKIPKEHNCK